MSSARRIGSYSVISSALTRMRTRAVRPAMSPAITSGEGSQPIAAQ